MEDFKIKNYNRSHTKSVFPPFQTLSEQDCTRIRQNITELLGLSSPCDPTLLMRDLFAMESRYTVANAEDDGFDLKAVLDDIHIAVPEDVYVNWDQFSNIDRMRFSDLRANFDDIWYHAADDIDIFDLSLSWIISISHYGAISYIKLSEK